MHRRQRPRQADHKVGHEWREVPPITVPGARTHLTIGVARLQRPALCGRKAALGVSQRAGTDLRELHGVERIVDALPPRLGGRRVRAVKALRADPVGLLVDEARGREPRLDRLRAIAHRPQVLLQRDRCVARRAKLHKVEPGIPHNRVDAAPQLARRRSGQLARVAQVAQQTDARRAAAARLGHAQRLGEPPHLVVHRRVADEHDQALCELRARRLDLPV
mmetsp:Transcript_46748/g.129934  ORF Transcript_46748/g.129934 Transcript_46748/m.129934 type:complete len:220 (+) Transcript_46748:121-780(+)|eukprot:6704345-Prymnesium_polylepis.1